MRNFVSQNLNEIGAAFTVLAFLLSIAVLAFSAYLYVTVRRDELQKPLRTTSLLHWKIRILMYF